MGPRKVALVTIRLSSLEEKARLDALEESLEAKGVIFDTGYDVEKGLRDWELDESLEGPLSPQEIISRLRKEGFRFIVHRKSPALRGRRLEYRVGDVFRVPLGPKRFGYGRILIRHPPMILAEFFMTVARRDPSLDELRDMDTILRIYVLDAAIAEDRTWEVIGHVPVQGKAVPPVLWIKSALNGKLYLLDDPVHQGNRKLTTWEEIRRLGAQPSRVYGVLNAEKQLRRSLHMAGVLPAQ